jgi:spermidine/putrescine transport system permease protein
MAVATDERVMDAAAAPPPVRTERRHWTRLILPVYSGLVMFYLIVPILVVVLYSFNRSNGVKVVTKWKGFSFSAYSQMFAYPDLTSAVKNSLLVAIVSTIIATVLGTIAALALVRYHFRGKQTTDFILFANIAAPEIVLGAALLAFFVSAGIPLGLTTIIIAHVMFNIAYVTITVRARLSGYDLSIEEAARDLGAHPFTTFRLVTLPIIFPGILAGALLVFALSIDDFVITSFNAGSVTTFPLWVYGASRIGIPPQVFAIATLIFTVGVLFAGINIIVGGRKRRQEMRPVDPIGATVGVAD